MKASTYIAVYKKEHPLPVALFADENDAENWHANPNLYSNCRRRVVISPDANGDTTAEKLLRILVTPGDDDRVGYAIEEGQKLLGIKTK